MNLKTVWRWLLRRWTDSNVGASYIAWLETPLAVLVGFDSGIYRGILTLVGFRVGRSVIGYFDLRYIGATKYMNDYLTSRAPSNVKVIVGDLNENKRKD